jgi:hypothetical protein
MPFHHPRRPNRSFYFDPRADLLSFNPFNRLNREFAHHWEYQRLIWSNGGQGLEAIKTIVFEGYLLEDPYVLLPDVRHYYRGAQEYLVLLDAEDKHAFYGDDGEEENVDEEEGDVVEEEVEIDPEIAEEFTQITRVWRTRGKQALQGWHGTVKFMDRKQFGEFVCSSSNRSCRELKPFVLELLFV